MKLLIAGSKGLGTMQLVEDAILYTGIDIDYIEEVCRCSDIGLDRAIGWWADNHNIPSKIFKADWKNLEADGAVIKKNGYGAYDSMAGVRRNKIVCDYCDALLAIIDGETPGVEHMISIMEKKNKEHYVYEV